MAFKGSADSYNIYFHESKYALPMFTNGPDVQVFDFTGGKKRNIAEQIASLSQGQVYDGKEAPFKQVNNEEIALVVRVK